MTHINVEEVIRLRRESMKMKDIAKIFQCHPSSIAHILSKNKEKKTRGNPRYLVVQKERKERKDALKERNEKIFHLVNEGTNQRAVADIFKISESRLSHIIRQYREENNLPIPLPNGPSKHGSLGMYYRHKCRCDKCRETKKAYDREWRRKKLVSKGEAPCTKRS